MAGLSQGVAVIDRNLQVRAWNHGAEDLWGLREDEVRGQHFLGLDMGLPVEQLKPLIRDTLRESGDGVDGAGLTLQAINRRGKSIRVKVSAAALQGSDKLVQGVILTMEEQPPGDGLVTPPNQDGLAASTDGEGPV
jgi:two-component system CheB/CheR fusion protein